MHLSALNYGRLFFETYRDNLPAGSKIVDIGSQNVNGSIKDVCPQDYEYIGVDFVEGKGVDIILDDPYSLPFESETIDAIVCSSCFEHSDMFWLVFNEILRILKPTGLVYINAPSNGYIHRWPVDCWRFYPDAGNALVTWAKRNGYNPVNLESFIGTKANETIDGAWNDFVAVFAKDETLAHRFRKKMIDSLEDFDNARTPGSNELANFQSSPPDFRLIEQLRLEKKELITRQQVLESQAADAAQRLATLELAARQGGDELSHAQREVISAREEASNDRGDMKSARDEIKSLRAQLKRAKEHNHRAADESAMMLHGIYQSSSWKLTAPLRVLSRAMRGQRPLVAGGLRARLLGQIKPLYWAIPPKLRTPILHWGYRNLEPVFRGSPHYEFWKHGSPRHVDIADSSLLPLDTLEPITKVDGTIAIHLHMYYHDLADEFADALKNMPFAYDLYVSVKDAEGEQACRAAFANLEKCKTIKLAVVQNRGRDIAPMFCVFGESLREYDFIAHLHSKKSLYNSGATEGWRQYLVSNLLGSTATIGKIFNLLSQNFGIVYPQNYKLVPHQANTWLANKGMGAAWCARLGIAPVPQGYFDFPAGSMFWATGKALQPLFNANISINDFAEEAGQTDGTFAHCLERLLVLSAKKQGLKPGIIQDMENPTWSAWRLEQSTGRPFSTLVDQFANPKIKCIAFDIFDTLMIRPLLDAESTKRIVAANLEQPLARMYSDYRVVAESEARAQKGKDVDLSDIYSRFQQLTRLSVQEVSAIRALEEMVEHRSLHARSGGVELFEQAKASGKPVVLISDMFLPKQTITRALDANGIRGWSEFYLSNKVGLRKDTGDLYKHVLSVRDLQANEVLMVGDNERSDLQIPCDMGFIGLHVLRPVEIARSLPRLRRFVEKYEFAHDLNAELTLGLLFLKNFSAVSYPDLNPGSLFQATPYNVGYSLVGPMLTSMAQWLIDNAAKDQVERLYFLAREGQLMKSVYDVWAQGLSNAPAADYLVVSRRTCGVPLVKTMDDIRNVSKGDYYLNSAADFLQERFGLELSETSWQQIASETGIERTTPVEVRNENLTALEPLLISVSEQIFALAKDEHKALMLYLRSMRVTGEQKSAVVDIGYGATIQGYLCKLTGAKIDGYYLATDERSINIAKSYDVVIRGCLMENVERNLQAPTMYLRSFEVEKLLSSSNAQILKYSSIDGVNLQAHHRELTDAEINCNAFREDLQKGVIQFAKDAVNIRTTLLSSFAPSLEVSKELSAEFFSRHSSEELELLSQVLLDDHYCGRGVV